MTRHRPKGPRAGLASTNEAIGSHRREGSSFPGFARGRLVGKAGGALAGWAAVVSYLSDERLLRVPEKGNRCPRRLTWLAKRTHGLADNFSKG